MKKLLVIIGLIPITLLAVDLTEYKADRSNAQVFLTGFNYHLGMTEGKVVSHFGNLSLNFERFQATSPSSYNISFNGNLSGNFVVDTADTAAKRLTYQIKWGAKYNKYLLSGKNLFGFAKLDGDALTNYDYPATRATIGIGFGKFTSATPLARALRIEEEMLGRGVLIDSLSTGMLMRFAQELSVEKRNEYKEKHYYWEKEYYSALERILKESSLLHNSTLGSDGSLIIKDVLDEYISPRYYGYEGYLGVGYDLFPAYKATGRAAFATLGFDYARPLGNRAQLVEKSNIRIPFTGGKLGKELYSSLLLSLLYEINSNIDLMGTYQLNLDRTKIQENEDYKIVLNNQLTGTLSIVVVEHLIISNTLTINHSTQASGLSAEVSSTISYRIF